MIGASVFKLICQLTRTEQTLAIGLQLAAAVYLFFVARDAYVAIGDLLERAEEQNRLREISALLNNVVESLQQLPDQFDSEQRFAKEFDLNDRSTAKTLMPGSFAIIQEIGQRSRKARLILIQLRTKP